MSLEKLREASDVLREPGESVEGRDGERQREQADRPSELNERDRRPDHGRIARHQQTLTDIEADEPAGAEADEPAGAEADEPAGADAIDEALILLDEYRETVEGI